VCKGRCGPWAAQIWVAFLLLNDLFSDEPCTNDVCKFRCLLGADLPVMDYIQRITARCRARR